MKNIKILSLLTVFFLSLISAQFNKAYSQDEGVGQHHFVRYQYREIPLGRIKPKGWLLNQLKIMMKGTTGHLDEVYEKLKKDNGWLGGAGDSWEETPYWLDGAVPLAWLLNDKPLQLKVGKYINWVLVNQRPSGYFGPITKWERETGQSVVLKNSENGEDWWPKIIMLKVLQQYYLATNDKRVIDFMTAFFHYEARALDKSRLGNWSDWATARGADNILTAQWLYGITKDSLLLNLCDKIQGQSFPWSQWFAGRDWVINAAAQQNDKEWMQRHGVNVAMGLKDPIVNFQRTGDSSFLRAMQTGWNDLMELHGLPYGMFSADEDLHGNSPTQGTELCAVVETMFSLEQAMAMTGNTGYMDALERIVYNALPAQTTDSYNEKQYFQIANQVQISRGIFNFSLPFERRMNNVLGMRSGYTCCLANMHQGWTKFASHLWYTTPDNGLAALEYGPNQTDFEVGAENVPISISEETNFPFDETVEFKIKTQTPVSFPLQLRIPTWCKRSEITVNGENLCTDVGGRMITINRIWKNGDHLRLQLPMRCVTTNWGRNSRTIERGPLVYALKIRERWEKGSEEKEGSYYSVYPESEWNFGILQSSLEDPETSLQTRKIKDSGVDFIWNLEHTPMEIMVEGRRIPEWKLVDGVAPQPVTDRTGIYRGRVEDSVYRLTLVPYGCTKIRIVAFPVVK